jgi:hypothetical protein
VWKIPASRGDAGAIQVTKNGGGPAIESPDGTHLYYLRVPGGGSFAGSASDPELCRVPIGGGPEVKIADSVRHSAFAVTKKGVWYVRKPEAQERGLTIGEKHFAVWLYSFTTGDSRLVAVVPGQSPLAGIAVSPDSRWLLYSPARIQADLMLVENFR